MKNFTKFLIALGFLSAVVAIIKRYQFMNNFEAFSNFFFRKKNAGHKKVLKWKIINFYFWLYIDPRLMKIHN